MQKSRLSTISMQNIGLGTISMQKFRIRAISMQSIGFGTISMQNIGLGTISMQKLRLEQNSYAHRFLLCFVVMTLSAVRGVVLVLDVRSSPVYLV